MKEIPLEDFLARMAATVRKLGPVPEIRESDYLEGVGPVVIPAIGEDFPLTILVPRGGLDAFLAVVTEELAANRDETAFALFNSGLELQALFKVTRLGPPR